jgi:hypothetical protein
MENETEEQFLESSAGDCAIWGRREEQPEGSGVIVTLGSLMRSDRNMGWVGRGGGEVRSQWSSVISSLAATVSTLSNISFSVISCFTL